MILIVGGDSVIGGALAKYCEREKIFFHASTRKRKLISNSRPFFDLREPEIIDYKQYDAAVICIGLSYLSYCEMNPALTREINVNLTINLISHLNRLGVFTVVLSTNQVFDGEKPFRKTTDKRCPINEYGRQKSELESLVEKFSNYSIVRITKVISSNLPLLVQWKEKLEAGLEIKAFEDMSVCPVHLSRVIEKIKIIIEKKEPVIYHCSGENDLSYFDYAKFFAQENGYDINLVTRDSYKSNKEINYNVPIYTSLEE